MKLFSPRPDVELLIIEDYELTNKPEVAIFLEYKNGNCLINKNGKNWLVQPKAIRMAE